MTLTPGLAELLQVGLYLFLTLSFIEVQLPGQ